MHLFYSLILICRCYLVNTAGFILADSWWESEFEQNIFFQPPNQHLTQVQPEIAIKLLEKGIMIHVNCTKVGEGKIVSGYKVKLHVTT